jgi:RNA polymerase sigma-70 factor (ECF subfamily)
MTLPDPPDDPAELLERIRDGDEEALTRLLLHYEPRIKTAAHVLLGPLLRPHLDSVDLVQSVHRMLLPGLRGGKYDLSDSEQLIALAVTLLRRKVARSWRRLRREHDLQLRARADGVLPENMAAAEPEDPAQAAELKDGILHLLGHFKDDERRLLELRLQGLSTPQIAEQLGCDAHALRARLSRLRQRLRELGYTRWI